MDYLFQHGALTHATSIAPIVVATEENYDSNLHLPEVTPTPIKNWAQANFLGENNSVLQAAVQPNYNITLSHKPHFRWRSGGVRRSGKKIKKKFSKKNKKSLVKRIKKFSKKNK